MFAYQPSLSLSLVPDPVQKKPLRDYQKKAIEQVMAHYERGIKSVGLISPTGSGKTLMATDLLRKFVEKGERVLFIIHRQPLVEQTVKTLRSYGIESVGYIKAGYPHANDHDQVIVASIQTLARRDYPPNIGLVVFDETHTTSFYKTAQKLLNFYAQSPVIALSKVKFLHLTATPFRLKKKEYFGNHIQAFVQAPHIGQLIRRGYLVPARHFGYDGLQDFSKLETGKDGDVTKSQLSILCNDLDYNRAIVKHFLETCPNRKAICFAGSVKQSLLLTELLNEAGIKTEHIQAETPDDVRDDIFQRFKRGDTQIISSVGTLTEGFDEPSVEAVILGRPTKSLALLIQMCGRGLRLFEGKKDCLLLDFAENFKRLGRVDTKRKITLCPKKEKEIHELKQCPNCRSYVNVFSRICPHCGYVFKSSEKDEDPFFDQQFGELLDPQLEADIKYIRSQRKSRFTKGLNPDTLWELWEKRVPERLFCNDWLYGAVFKGDRSPYAQEIFRNYLYSICPDGKKEWIEFHLKLEFFPPQSNYSFPPNFQHWSQILQVSPQANFAETRRAYQDLCKRFQDDTAQIKPLNLALTQAHHFREIKISQEAQQLLNQPSIDYQDLINKINEQMDRIGMTINDGIAFLEFNYGVKSRQLLSDEQLIDFFKELIKRESLGLKNR